jgi:hypothetical protein
MLVWLFAALLCAAPLGLAQQSGTVIAQVPFQFKVSDVPCRTGEYSFVRPRADASLVVFVRNEGTGESILFAGQFFSADLPRGGQAKLVFHRYGEQYFLREIHDGTGVVSLMAGREERKLQVAGLRSEKTVLLAGLQATRGQ